MEKERINIIGEPYPFATAGEIPWRKIMEKAIPDKIASNYLGLDMIFHYVEHLHRRPLDVDNLCEPVFTVLIGKKKHFGGKRANIQWFRAEKIPDSTGKLELKFSSTIPEIKMNSVIFDFEFEGKLPKSATDENFAKIIENAAKEKLKQNEQCIVRIQFHGKNVNLGNISSGTIKPIIDCLYPILGGIRGTPDDHNIRVLQVEKTVTDLKNKIRITISRLGN